MEKVIDIEERIPSMRDKRRRRTNRKFIFIVTLFMFALLVVLYFQSSLSRIDKITLSGTNLHDDAFYIAASDLAVDKSLWGFTIADVEKDLLKVESVQEVKVSRKWLREVTVELVEWAPIAYLENDGQYSLLLENGEVFFQEQMLPEEDAPILNGFAEAKHKKRITKQLKEMESNVYQLISEIIYEGTAEDPDHITVYMDDGYEVKAIIPTFAEKMAYYAEITAQLQEHEKGVIDMEVGTYFTPYSKIYGATEEEVQDEEVENDEENE